MSRETADVVIVGAGVIGCALARELASARLQVAVVERERPGAGASGAAGGILSPQAEADGPSPLLDFGLESRSMFPGLVEELRDETGIEVPYRASGTLYVALDREEEEQLETRYAWQTEAGLPVERFSGGRVSSLEPALSPGVRLALRFPYDHQIDNVTLTSALAASAEERGVRFITGLEVRSVLSAAGAVTGVAAGAERIEAPRVVICAGAWSSLIENGGMPIPSMPVRGQMVALESDEVRLDRVIYRDHAYLVPRLDGRILAGSTMELAGFDPRATVGGVRFLLDQAQTIVPALAEGKIAGIWTGFRPGTPDGLPILGPAGPRWPDGLWFATGHLRNGILLAPLTARLIAEAIVSGRTSLPLDPFLASRFAV